MTKDYHINIFYSDADKGYIAQGFRVRREYGHIGRMHVCKTGRSCRVQSGWALVAVVKMLGSRPNEAF